MTFDPSQQLGGGDLRSIGKSNELVGLITTQVHFDELFACLFHEKRLIVMRAADAIEKIAKRHPEWLQKHKAELLKLIQSASDKELRWHLVLLVSRLELGQAKRSEVLYLLESWARDRLQSRIVRVNAIQAMADMLNKQRDYYALFQRLLIELEQEGIPSLSARIRKIRKQNNMA